MSFKGFYKEKGVNCGWIHLTHSLILINRSNYVSENTDLLENTPI